MKLFSAPLASLAFAAALLAQVSTCSAPTTISTSTVTALVQQACSFEPTAATIANLVSTNPNLNTAELVAQVICSTVGTPPAATTPSASASTDATVAQYHDVVSGKVVPIVGHWVAK